MYKTQHNSYHPVQCTLLDQSAIQQYNSTNKFCIVCERSTWNKKTTNEMKIIFLDLPISFLYKTAQTTCSSATLHSSYNQSIIDIVKQVKLCHKWSDMATQMYHYHYILQEYIVSSGLWLKTGLSPAILISDNSAVSVLTSILKQPVPSLALLSTLNLTTVTLSTTIFLSLK